MASRKLKFKPKPVVGGGVRRLREKEEVLVPEITIKEPNAEKELTFGNVSQIDTKKEQLSIENINEENVSKKARLEQSEKEQENVLMNSDVKLNNLDGSPSKGVSESADKMIIETSSQVTSNTIIPSSAQIEEMTHSGISISEGLESTPMDKSENNTSCLADSLSNDKELCVETDLTLNNEKNSVLNSHPSKETSVDSKPMDKSDAGKAYRFGRSKFKPVLNNAATRKKAEIGDDQVTNKNNHSEVYPVGMVVRTESVIKCVKSETRRPSIVDEIAESFSSLESDEIGEPPISNSVQVTAEALVYRFDYGNEDVNNSLSEPDTTKRVTHVAPPKSKDLLDKAKSVSEIIVALSGKSELGSNSTGQTRSNQKLDSNLQCESVNINNQPAVTNKVPTSQCESVNINNQPAVTNKVPTSPLKPSSKMLVPKPSPNLLDMAARRISFHGSDSEEDSKRKIFLKNDHLGKKEKKEKDIKNNKRKISQGSTYSKLGQEALEKFTQKFGKVEKLDAPDKSKLTMLDLIFYNPKSNPMSMSSDKPTGGRKKENKFEVSGMVEEKLVEESVDDVEEPAPAVPVPQLKIGPDGQIMLDPKSLIIETTEVKEKRAEMEKSAVIRETGITRYNTYSKKKHSRRDWTAQETLQFYKALNTIGSDFTLMTKLFPKRSRHELKLKFKKEEKTNMKLIDKAMTAPADFDFSSLEEEMKRENEEIARIAEEKRLAAEAAREARALKKEEKKKKGEKKYRYPNYLRVRDAAFRNFDESEVKVMETLTERKKRRKNKKRKSAQYVSSSDDEVEITNIDLDSKESEEVERDLLKITNKIMIPGIRRGRRVRKTRKLEECEEINETLKRKLQEMESNSNDGYTPNGPEADMLFGSPARDPFSDHLSQDAEESQWSMEVTSVPSVENSVLVNNIEDVSELSELGSFGQNDDVLDLSLPERINSRSETAQGGSPSDGVLNRHLISQSIQIIDELTSDQHLNAEENITLERKSADENPFINDSNKEEQSENRIPLPSFESVSSRLPVIYSVQDQYVSAQSDENTATTHQGGNSPSTPVESHPNSGEHVSNDKGIVVSYYCNNSEECILGD